MESNNDSHPEYEKMYFSFLSEQTILRLGVLLHGAVLNAERVDELELLVGVVAEFTVMTSTYGEKTDRIPESLAVDMNESVLMKLESLKRDDNDTEWMVYIQQFKDSLLDVSQKLAIDVSFE